MSTDTDRNQLSSLERKKNRVPQLPDYVCEGLRKIVDYLWDDEFAHYRTALTDAHSAGSCNEAVSDHIFTQLVHVRAWMDGGHIESEWFIGELMPSPPEPTNDHEWPSTAHGWRLPMPCDQVRDPLGKIFDYIWDDELTHFRATVADNVAAGDPYAYVGDHIFVHLVHVKAWLEDRNICPEWYIEDLDPHNLRQTSRNHRPASFSAPRVPLDMKLIEPSLIQRLLDAAHEAVGTMSETLNLDLAVDNHEFEDVKNLSASLDRLSAVLDAFRQRASS